MFFKGKKLPVFTDSEFWHGKQLLEGKYIPKTNTEFWVKKITRNIEKDKEVNGKLIADGWTFLRFREVDIRKKLLECANSVDGTFNKL